MDVNQIIQGDALSVLKGLPDGIVQTCVTSPPYYGLRDYGVEGQIGLEETPEVFVSKLVEVFREVRRILRKDGTLWLNIADSYAGYHGNAQVGDNPAPSDKPGYRENMRQSTVGISNLKPKDLMMIPARVAMALQADGWYLRSDIIWNKPACMPESVEDRPTKSHEYIFLLSKNDRYYYDNEAIREPARDWGTRDRTNGKYHSNLAPITGGPHHGLLNGNNAATGRNKRSVWTINPQPYSEAHFATFPPKLIEPCILAGSQRGDIILDPFIGAGTTALVAIQHGRNYLGIDLNVSYVQLAEKRIATVQQNLWTSGSEAIAV